ncbi:MAG TPA: tripartite tricarboxylate transporter permease [Nocardiopsis listeri]|uniref:tripartite tricarboxylate transporter permease n=1 Tax=Nocardiopsis listeri TaxID=53440 RepID=UPI001D449760|nr:tripartite tricarboxylate transporter permease [Nocardiopsis listeri]HJE57276.1 tripartite tricarboxylate transporter permease [Nocardiopsis listeri]
MDFAPIGAGMAMLFQPEALMWLVAGLCLGFMVGVLPGLSTSNTAALLLPFAIGLPTENSLILIVSIYAGSQFGAAVPAILMNVPGEAGSAVTALDGYAMTRKGKAGLAVGVARAASSIGGTASGLVVLFLLGPLAVVALSFNAREMLVVILLGFVVASSLMGDSVRKGLMVGVLGLVLATVGASPLTGQNRFTFGTLELYDGIEFIPALIGLFAISEMLYLAARSRHARKNARISYGAKIREEVGDAVKGARETVRYPTTLGQSGFIGLIIGLVPGAGTTIANFVSYSFAKRRSRNGRKFGTGHPEGIIASEACDNSVASATLVPTLTLGIPGSATMAVVLAFLYVQGIQPGPRILVTHPGEAYAAVLAMIVASILILPLGILLASPLALITRVPVGYLVATILMISLAGAFAVRFSLFDVGLAVAFGVLGLVLRLNGYPVIPLILGLILGPLAEENLMRSLALGNNSIAYFFGSPTAIVLWCVLGASIVYLMLRSRKDKARSTIDGDDDGGDTGGDTTEGGPDGGVPPARRPDEAGAEHRDGSDDEGPPGRHRPDVPAQHPRDDKETPDGEHSRPRRH